VLNGSWVSWAQLGREVDLNVEIHGAGNLGLNPQQEADLVTFMKMLSDGYKIPGATTVAGAL
jgi:hypothetical protein